MPWDAESFSKHNHSLHGERAGHAARIANAVLKSSGDEGLAIAVGNKWAQHHRANGGGLGDFANSQALHLDSGGQVSTPPDPSGLGGFYPSTQNQNPIQQSQIQRYSSYPTEKLQELGAMLGGTPQGQIVQRLLQQRHSMPNATQYGGGQGQGQPQQVPGQQGPAAIPQVPQLAPTQATQQQPVRRGGQVRADGGAALPKDARESARPTGGPWWQHIPTKETNDAMERRPPAVHSPIVAEPDLDPSRPGIRGGGKVPHRQGGGSMTGVPLSMADPWWTRQEASGANRGGGYLAGSTGGRADSIKTTAPGGAYVLPADVVSGIGEGNSLAGARAIDEMLNTGPYGQRNPSIRRGMGPPRPPSIREPAALQAKGGGVHQGPAKETPVALSHGEYVLTPLQAMWLAKQVEPKVQTLKHAHSVLDAFVLHMRKKNIERLKKLPGPVKEAT